MRNPPLSVTLVTGFVLLALLLGLGLFTAERGLGTLFGAQPTPATVYFSRSGVGRYDVALLGLQRQLSLVLPLARVDAEGRLLTLSTLSGRRLLRLDLQPTALAPGQLDGALQEIRGVVVRLVGGVSAAVRQLLGRGT
jgi:hypothetical protein